MAATFEYQEHNGAATGSPALGTVITGTRTDCNWKNIDDSTTAYSSSPVTAGNNSFSKYQCGHFTGTFNSISAGLWAHTAGTFPTGCTLMGVVTSTYAAASASTNAALTTNMTTAIAIASGQTVLFTGTSPATASPSASITANPGYSQFLVNQLQTTTAAPAGDIPSITTTLQYNEN